jgi:hypothetical protein
LANLSIERDTFFLLFHPWFLNSTRWSTQSNDWSRVRWVDPGQSKKKTFSPTPHKCPQLKTQKNTNKENPIPIPKTQQTQTYFHKFSMNPTTKKYPSIVLVLEKYLNIMV